jgi:predicted HTH transcriptional regulator
MTTPPPFDRAPVPDATLDDLDFALVYETMVGGVRLGRLKVADVPGLSADDLRPTEDQPYNREAALRYLERFSGVVHMADDSAAPLLPTIAGLMAFTHTPDRWVPSSGADVARYETDPRFVRSESVMAVPAPIRARIEAVRGSIFTVIDRTVELLRDACTISAYDEARIVNRLDTPINVLRELTTNGLVHRDLEIYGSQVRIQIFPGYIEWISPGRLPPQVFPDEIPLTLDLLLKGQFARNPALATFLFHRGYIEKFGFGLDDVVASLAELKRKAPEFHNDKHSFRVRVTRPRAAGEDAQSMATKEGRQQAILQLFEEQPTWTPQEITQRLGIARTTLQYDLRALTKTGQIKATGATHSRAYQLGEKQSSQEE